MDRQKIKNGGVAEWLNATVLKTVSGLTVARRFESYRLRQLAVAVLSRDGRWSGQTGSRWLAERASREKPLAA